MHLSRPVLFAIVTLTCVSCTQVPPTASVAPAPKTAKTTTKPHLPRSKPHSRSEPTKPAKLDNTVGRWENQYPDTPELVGVWIQQLSDNSDDARRYVGKHPCMVYYIFPNGWQHGFHYEPDGTVTSNFWSKTPGFVLDNLHTVYRPDLLQTLRTPTTPPDS